jgi:hypothetical protein
MTELSIMTKYVAGIKNALVHAAAAAFNVLCFTLCRMYQPLQMRQQCATLLTSPFEDEHHHHHHEEATCCTIRRSNTDP